MKITRDWIKKEKRRLERQLARKSQLMKSEKKTDNELSAEFRVASDGFLTSRAWKEIRLKVIAKYGGKCMKCGLIPTNKSFINVDHIKPRKFFPELSLEFDNLQVLCARCNKNKGNTDQTDYRPK